MDLNKGVEEKKERVKPKWGGKGEGGGMRKKGLEGQRCKALWIFSTMNSDRSGKGESGYRLREQKRRNRRF